MDYEEEIPDEYFLDEDLPSLPVSRVSSKKFDPRISRFDAIIEDKASKYGVHPDLIRSVIHQESRGNDKAVSRTGARGLMQLMPGTAQGLGVRNSFDPEENIDGGTRYLKQQIDKYGLRNGIAAYNAGPGNVEKYGGVPPFRETQDYTRNIMGLFSPDSDESNDGFQKYFKSETKEADPFAKYFQSESVSKSPTVRSITPTQGDPFAKYFTEEEPKPETLKTYKPRGFFSKEASALGKEVKAIPGAFNMLRRGVTNLAGQVVQGASPFARYALNPAAPLEDIGIKGPQLPDNSPGWLKSLQPSEIAKKASQYLSSISEPAVSEPLTEFERKHGHDITAPLIPITKEGAQRGTRDLLKKVGVDPKSTAGKIIQGVLGETSEVGASLSTPANIGLLAAGQKPNLSRGAMASFTPQMIQGTAHGLETLKEGISEIDPKKIAEGLVGIGSSGYFSAMGMKGAIGKESAPLKVDRNITPYESGIKKIDESLREGDAKNFEYPLPAKPGEAGISPIETGEYFGKLKGEDPYDIFKREKMAEDIAKARESEIAPPTMSEGPSLEVLPDLVRARAYVSDLAKASPEEVARYQNIKTITRLPTGETRIAERFRQPDLEVDPRHGGYVQPDQLIPKGKVLQGEGFEKTIPEKPETLNLQVESLSNGRNKAVLVTPGEQMPEVPKRFKVIPSEVGVWIYDPLKISRQKIEKSVADGSYNQFLGIVEPKSPNTTLTVTANQKGVEAKTAVVSPENVKAQADEFRKQFPMAQIEIGGPEKTFEVLNKRLSAPEQTKIEKIEDNLTPTQDLDHITPFEKQKSDQVTKEMSRIENEGLEVARRYVKGLLDKEEINNLRKTEDGNKVLAQAVNEGIPENIAYPDQSFAGSQPTYLGSGLGALQEMFERPKKSNIEPAKLHEVKAEHENRFSSRVFERLKEDHPELTGEVSYERMNMKKDAERAVDLLTTNKQKAYRVAMGAEELPNQTSTAVNIAMAEKALDEGNYSLYSQLVKKRSLDQTRRGQELVAEKGSVSDNSASRYVKELIKMRMDKLGDLFTDIKAKIKREAPSQKVTRLVDREVGKIKKQISSKSLDLMEAQRLIDSLACK